jgi:Fe-S cluster assembly ATPase SufC
MLDIKNLHAEIQGNMILKGLNLSVKSREFTLSCDPMAQENVPLLICLLR